jgi:hypothetical protein
MYYPCYCASFDTSSEVVACFFHDIYMDTSEQCIELLHEWSDFCEVQSVLHDMCRGHFRKWNVMIAIPAILLSTVGGAANISISRDPSQDHQIKTIIFGSFSLASAACFTIHRYLSLPELQQSHDFYSDEYAKLMNEIRMQLKIDHSEHKTYCHIVEFCKACKRELDILIDKAPAIPMNIRNKYKKISEHMKTDPHIHMHQSLMLIKPVPTTAQPTLSLEIA